MRFVLFVNSRATTLSLLLSACILSLLFFSACSSNNPTQTAQTNTPTGNAPPRTAVPMPPVARSSSPFPSQGSPPIGVQYGWTLLDNRHMNLSDYRGKVVVLDFYATWCPPCRESTPHLVELQRRFGTKGLQVIGLNVGGPEDRYAIPQFVQEYKIQYSLGFPDDQMTDAMMSDDDSIPQAFVFDQSGRLVKRFIGYSDDMPDEMEQVIKTAMSSE